MHSFSGPKHAFLEVGLHGKAAAEALQSGAERVRRELQAQGMGYHHGEM